MDAHKPASEPRLVTLQVAAERASCHTRTIRRRIASGDLTGYRFGKRLLRVDLNELDALLTARPVQETA